MAKTRVLVVDDSVVMRRMISDVLQADPALEVVGVAANGKIALQKIPHVNPDIITLDVEMPEMDGITTLRELRKTYAKLPVIMFSTLTEKGATTTIEALSSGASDYVTKPSNVGNIVEGLKRLAEELIPKIKELCPQDPPHIPLSTHAEKPGTATPGSRLVSGAIRQYPIEILCIGTSTGGPNALTEVFKGFPSDFPVPIVIVQHMPPIFTASLAERLTANSALQFSEGHEGDLLKPGHAYIAPGGRHMEIGRDGLIHKIHLHDAPPENSCRPAVDVLFRSVALLYGATTLGVILTGMGQDGLRGCELIRERQGQILAQDKESSVVWGMPGAVVNAGMANKVLPLNMVSGEIVRRVNASRHLSGIIKHQ